MTVIDREAARRLAISFGVRVPEGGDLQTQAARGRAILAVDTLVESDDATARVLAVADLIDALDDYFTAVLASQRQ